MSVNLVTDPTEQGYNSFVSVEEADEYFSGVYFGSSASWDELEDEDKARLLITASRALSALQWTGRAVGSLAFPRIYTSTYSADPVTPGFLKSLVCEWAKWLFQEGPGSGGSVPGEAPIVSAKLGDLAVEFGAVQSTAGIPQVIASMLTPLVPTYLSVSTRARSLSMRY